jgi:hypothetical protein
VDERLELEFYRLGRPFDPAGDLKAQLSGLISRLPADWFDERRATERIRYDAASQCLLVALSQPRHRVLESLLAETSKP